VYVPNIQTCLRLYTGLGPVLVLPWYMVLRPIITTYSPTHTVDAIHTQFESVKLRALG
jgi:hypothetical protein